MWFAGERGRRRLEPWKASLTPWMGTRGLTPCIKVASTVTGRVSSFQAVFALIRFSLSHLSPGPMHPQVQGEHRCRAKGEEFIAGWPHCSKVLQEYFGTARVYRQDLQHHLVKLHRLSLWLKHSLWSNTCFFCALALLVFPASLPSLLSFCAGTVTPQPSAEGPSLPPCSHVLLGEHGPSCICHFPCHLILQTPLLCFYFFQHRCLSYLPLAE